ncbi:hypothetical protein L204_104841 [Cryptococcus depauperatus]
MPPTTDDKPSTAFEAFFYRYIFPRLPHDAQAIYMEPPTFAKPISFLPLFRLLIPYIGYIITLIAFIIVWSFMTSIIGYFSRVLRFSLRVIPIIAFALWIMGSSDQASTQELFAVVKEWAGFESEKHAGSDESTMGGLFGLKQNTEKKRAKPRTRSGSSSSPRARSKAGADHAKTTDLDLQKGINLVSSPVADHRARLCQEICYESFRFRLAAGKAASQGGKEESNLGCEIIISSII